MCQGEFSTVHLNLGLLVLHNLHSLCAVLLVDAASLDILDRCKVGTDRSSLLEVTTLLLGTESSSDRNAHSDDGSRNTHDRSVCGRRSTAVGCDLDSLRSGIDDLGRGRGDHVTELVCQTNEGRAEGRRRQLVEMDGNDTPSSLDEELDHEARSRKTSLGGGQDPGGDDQSRHDGGADDSPAATEPLRCVTQDGATNTRTSLHENRSAVRSLRVEVLLLLHERGVGVLARVGVEVEPGHEEDAVNDHAPLALQHDLSLSPESARSRLRLALLLCIKELLGFGEANADKTNEDGETGTDPEDSLPGVCRVTYTQVGASGENITERVTLLEDTRHKTTSVDTGIISM